MIALLSGKLTGVVLARFFHQRAESFDLVCQVLPHDEPWSYRKDAEKTHLEFLYLQVCCDAAED